LVFVDLGLGDLDGFSEVVVRQLGLTPPGTDCQP
jgi:hypothetical protein